MTDRLIRLMRIITLVQAKPGILARELADRCGTSERTIYRDMDALSAMHIPITHLGHGKGYTFIGNFALYPLDWSSEEASAFSQLSAAMEEIKPLLPAGFESAYEKVMAAEYKYKADREEKAERAGKEAGSSLEWNGAGTGGHLAPLLNAILKEKCIRVDHNNNAEEEIDLEIDPYYLISLENRYHLIGYCHGCGTIRSFRVRHLSNIRLLDRRFSRKEFNLPDYTKRKWSMEEDSLWLEFKIRFSESVLKELEEGRNGMRPDKIESQGGCAAFKIPLERDREFIEWIGEFKEEAEILEPAHYRDAFRYQLESWLSLYK